MEGRRIKRKRGKERKNETRSNRGNKSPYLTRNGTLWHFSMDGCGWILPLQDEGKKRQRGWSKVQKKEPDDFYFAMKETADYQENRVRGINGRERQIKRRMKGRWRLDEETGPSSDGTGTVSNPFLWRSFLEGNERCSPSLFFVYSPSRSPFVFDKEEG